MNDTETRLADWAAEQTRHWQAKRLAPGVVERRLEEMNQALDHFFIFEFRARTVRIRSTPHYTAERLEQPLDSFSWRAREYLRFFRRVAERRPVRDGVLGMSMHDTSLPDPEVPLFAFQKPRGSSLVLIPDIDAVRTDFYTAEPVDEVRFAHKQDQAIFVGSTTGTMHTAESVAALASQRLRSAMFFRGNELVDFRLAKIVQCVTPEAEQAIRALGLRDEPCLWPEQTRCKFILSMDGNGATCSRVALTLRSRSVLLKYDSPHELYYFHALVPGVHYVAIARDEQVPEVVRSERDHPGKFRPLARASRQFFKEYLTPAPSIAYTAKVLNQCFLRCGFSAAAAEEI